MGAAANLVLVRRVIVPHPSSVLRTVAGIRESGQRSTFHILNHRRMVMRRKVASSKSRNVPRRAWQVLGWACRRGAWTQVHACDNG